MEKVFEGINDYIDISQVKINAGISLTTTDYKKANLAANISAST